MKKLREQISILAPAPPDNDAFTMWRAVFALAYVDGVVAPEELRFVHEVMDAFDFSEAQRAIIQKDMVDRGDVLALFLAINGQDLRAQFFRLARILIWCDGFLHEYELAMIESICRALGPERAFYEADLRWINRKPDYATEGGVANPNEAMARQIMMHMIEFYKSRAEIRA